MGIWVSVSILIVGLISFFYPRIQKKYLNKPILAIELRPYLEGVSRSRSFLSYSSTNDFTLPMNRDDVISLYSLTWNFEIIVKNKNSISGVSIKVYFKGLKGGSLNLKDNKALYQSRTIKGFEELSYPIEFKIAKEIPQGDVRKHEVQYPPEFKELEILIECSNESNSKFFYCYNMNSNNTSLIKLKDPLKVNFTELV